jgi:hypothetical protein
MWQTRFSSPVAVACVLIFVATSALSVRGKSSTWDEPFHLTAGISQLQTGDPRMNADHPPLARLLAAFPALFMNTPSVAELGPESWKNADLYTAPNAIFGVIEDRLLWPSRLMMLTLAVLLGWLIHEWGTRLFGRGRSWLPLALYVFCPELLANAPLVATDMAATTFIFASFYTWWRYLQEPSAKRLAWCCLSVAAAFSAKHTAILLLPLLTLLGGIALIGTSILSGNFNRRLRLVCGGLLTIGASTVIGIDLFYFFDGVFLTPAEYLSRSLSHSQTAFQSIQPGAKHLSHYWPSWLPVPLPFYYVCGFLAVLANVAQKGLPTYFLGQVGHGGWPNYFVMLLLVKLPIPSLLLIGFGFSRALLRLPRDWWNLLFLSLPPLLLIWIASTGKMQIGFRHILPAFPFLFLLSGYTLQGSSTRWRPLIAGALVGLSWLSVWAIHPHYLMYFNFLGGGPERGWRISIVGDDWGQGDADLRGWLQARGITQLAYLPSGWGGVILNRAGIRYGAPPCEDTGELVAVHAASLMDVHSLETNRCYAWMRLREPDEKIGYSIFIYNSKNLRPPPPANLELFSQALALQMKGQLQEAISLYQSYLKQEPDYFQAHFNLAHALMGSNQCAAAIPEFQRTLELWSGYRETHLHLSRCYRELGLPGQAEHHEQIYKDDP